MMGTTVDSAPSLANLSRVMKMVNVHEAKSTPSRRIEEAVTGFECRPCRCSRTPRPRFEF